MKKIRIVVIDDSAYNRRAITKMLEAMPNVEVVAYAVDGEEGVRKILDLKPDLATLDLEMPKMDGFTLLRIVMGVHPIPIIVVSSRSGDNQVFKALELGAVDFVAKPTGQISDELLKIRDDLQEKVRNVFNLNLERIRKREAAASAAPDAIAEAKVERTSAVSSKIDMVAIGASTGGPPALQSILSAFAGQLPFAVAVSQHMPAGFTKGFAERLNRASVLEVLEARDGDRVKPGTALIAPGGKNLLFQEKNGEVVARVVEPSPKDRYVPSVDAMFDSLAGIYGPRLLAVVLTGMGNDGSQGVRAVKKAGGRVLAESEESSIVFGMPREAIATGSVDLVAPLEAMAREIVAKCGS